MIKGCNSRDCSAWRQKVPTGPYSSFLVPKEPTRKLEKELLMKTEWTASKRSLLQKNPREARFLDESLQVFVLCLSALLNYQQLTTLNKILT